MAQTVTLQIPELLYQRLVNTTRATNRPLEEVMLYECDRIFYDVESLTFYPNGSNIAPLSSEKVLLF